MPKARSGSVRVRVDGRFEARATIDGKRLSFLARTRDEAEAKLAEARRQARRGTPIIMPGHQTLRQYLEHWHATRLYSSENTRRQYGGIIARHIVPAIGSVRLTGLTPDHIRKLLRGVETSREPRYSDRTIKYVKQVLSAALGDAVRERKLEWNPASAVRVREPVPRPKALLDWDQQASLLEAVRDDRLYAAFVLMTTLALRPGECFGLTWPDVDWERGLLKIRHALVKAAKGWELSPRTKTGKTAIMPLAEEVLEVLREHRVRQMAEEREMGEVWNNQDNLIFVTPLGTHIDPNNFRRAFKKVAPGLVPYSLRHSAATFALADGEDVKSVQGLLRHSRASVTLNVYSHAVDRVQRESAVRRAERLLGTR